MSACTIGDCLPNKKNVKVVLPVLPKKKVTFGVIISPSSSLSYDIDRRTCLSAAELTMLLAHGSDEYSGEGDAREMISLLFVDCAWISQNMDLVYPALNWIPKWTFSMVSARNKSGMVWFGG